MSFLVCGLWVLVLSSKSVQENFGFVKNYRFTINSLSQQYQIILLTGIFRSTFLQAVFFMCFFSFLFVKDFPFYSTSFITIWFKNFQAPTFHTYYFTHAHKEKLMYLFSQLFFKTADEKLKFQKKSKENTISSNLET